LCQAIRDEAHRFAQHYHHLLREKSLMGETARMVRKKRAIRKLQDEKDAGPEERARGSDEPPDASRGDGEAR
jgi:excinuclease UvrABC nuclease subunit